MNAKGFSESMEKDIILFYYYSSPSLPEDCYLELSSDIAYRNMFLLPCAENKIHFEFPMFEDHSYNTICNRKGVRSLIKRPSENEKYIIFRTKNDDTRDCNIIGFYKIGKAYYQETSMFNNNGFIWGIESKNAHLVKKGEIVYNGPTIRRGYRISWGSDEWNSILNNLLVAIKKETNYANKYRSETNRLIELFKDIEKINEWKDHCLNCENRNDCTLYRRFTIYNNSHPNTNIYSVINSIYTRNLYSRNVLNTIPKMYLK